MPRIQRVFSMAGVVLLLWVGGAKPVLAHGYGHYRHPASYHYVYYRSFPIYHAPERNLWFWYDAGHWSFGAALPLTYHRYLHDSVTVTYADPYPYAHYSTTRVRYPPRVVHHHHHYRQSHRPNHHHHARERELHQAYRHGRVDQRRIDRHRD